MLVVFFFGILPVFCQSNKAVTLREVLKPYFVPFEADSTFLKEEKAIIDLGRTLFYDKRLSWDGEMSCFSCHNLKNYGTNGDRSVDKLSDAFYRDVPSIYNIAVLPMFNADGSKETLKEKLKQSLMSSHELGNSDKYEVVYRISGVEQYKNMFLSAFPESSESISFDNVLNALEVFMKGLITPAPIDDFIKGNNDALTTAQIEGGHLFNDKNCYSCHTASNIGGQMVQKLGVTQEWPNQRDLGYYKIYRNPAYKMFFRVSPLRNVEKTAPYFHDASSNNLPEAIKRMGKYERGLEISADEASKIQAFLKSLTGDIPYEYIKRPNLPKS